MLWWAGAICAARFAVINGIERKIPVSTRKELVKTMWTRIQWYRTSLSSCCFYLIQAFIPLCFLVFHQAKAAIFTLLYKLVLYPNRTVMIPLEILCIPYWTGHDRLDKLMHYYPISQVFAKFSQTFTMPLMIFSFR